MSRHIQTLDPESRKLNNDTQNGKLILTCLDGGIWLFLLQNDVLVSAQVIPKDNLDKIGEIYIGKVKNVLPNIQAYFVEIANGQTCYLSFKDAEAAYVLNRKIDVANSTPQTKESFRLIQGDELPVQIIRNAIKTKPAAVSTKLELQSDYFVLKAGERGLGISNKIVKTRSKEIRELLSRELFVDVLSPRLDSSDEYPVDYAVIVRTACENLENIKLLDCLKQQREAFTDIFRKAVHRTCFSCILKNESPIISSIKRIPVHEYDEIITDIEDFHKLLSETFLTKESSNAQMISGKTIRFYNDNSFSLPKLYGLTNKLDNALSKKVWLKSGAYLVIEQTECLTTIDVNTGKNIHGNSSDNFIFQVNKEAAKEAALQMRLRNLSGIIIIDFINMKDSKQNDELLTYLSTLTSKDPIPTNVIDMTPLSLVEVTRKKTDMSLQEQLCNADR